jgi:S-adenosylmethionine/arginine decarboxylase-like enzyme
MTREEYARTGSWGLLASIDLHGCNPATIRDADRIRAFVAELCRRIDMRRFGECQVVRFGDNEDVAGFSMTQLIETSLISGHFVDKTRNTYLDVFSCKYFDPDIAVRYAAEFFEAADYSVTVTPRK